MKFLNQEQACEVVIRGQPAVVVRMRRPLHAATCGVVAVVLVCVAIALLNNAIVHRSFWPSGWVAVLFVTVSLAAVWVAGGYWFNQWQIQFGERKLTCRLRPFPHRPGTRMTFESIEQLAIDQVRERNGFRVSVRTPHGKWRTLIPFLENLGTARELERLVERALAIQDETVGIGTGGRQEMTAKERQGIISMPRNIRIADDKDRRQIVRRISLRDCGWGFGKAWAPFVFGLSIVWWRGSSQGGGGVVSQGRPIEVWVFTAVMVVIGLYFFFSALLDRDEITLDDQGVRINRIKCWPRASIQREFMKPKVEEIGCHSSQRWGKYGFIRSYSVEARRGQAGADVYLDRLPSRRDGAAVAAAMCQWLILSESRGRQT